MAFQLFTGPLLTVTEQSLNFGKSGEDLAAEFLKQNGYKILARNFRTKLGELDIVALDKNTVCFVEVKTRSSAAFGLPQEAVFPAKQRQIIKAALVFLQEKKLTDKFCRFDVAAVDFSQRQPQIEIIKNAFENNSQYAF